jgi:hypothetical protein
MPTFSIQLSKAQQFAQGSTGRLRFHEIYYPEERGYTARVFINQPDANADTPTIGNDHYVGRFSVMSRVYTPGNEERGLLPWAHSTDQNAEVDPPVTLDIDAFSQLKKFAKPGSEITVTLVLVDQKGKPLPDKLLWHKGITLEFD